MYTNHLQEYLDELTEQAALERESISLLDEMMGCLLGVLGRRLGARVSPQADLLQLTVRLLLISEGLARSETTSQRDGMHYLVAMGFEQSGTLLARFFATEQIAPYEDPLDNDHWYRLLLAFLHYLAGGYRVQALSVLRQLGKIANSLAGDFNFYSANVQALERFYRSTSIPNTANQLERWLLANEEIANVQGQHINLLAQRIRTRRDIALSNLGRDSEQSWLEARSLPPHLSEFWRLYLNRLEKRGITTFTSDQAGKENRFDWLRDDNDLQVVLPTGAGKTIIGELRTALALANNKQVVWLLPTRALVRQTTHSMRSAFDSLSVEVEELPITEDPIPLFDEALMGRQLAITTPERFSALIRANPSAIAKVGLVVVDEAQLLLNDRRGTTVEFALQKTKQLVPNCKFVLMTAFRELEDILATFLTQLTNEKPEPLISDRRLTRRIYGTVTNYQPQEASVSYPLMSLFPPKPQNASGQTTKAYHLLGKEKLTSNAGPTEIAQRFARNLSQSRLRSVIFVARVSSTETQAQQIAKKQEQIVEIPNQDVVRLEIELGRPSTIVDTGKKGIVPHHGRLTKLEQVFVEKWVYDDVVQTVIATPTLASGVNLPFDFSMVTYTHRDRDPLTAREVMNMIGRAGRAGYVSDGIGLIVKNNLGSPIATLDSSRAYFFHNTEPSKDKLGLSRLLLDCLQIDIGNIEFPLELNGLSFSQIQTLQVFIAEEILHISDELEQIISKIRLYPSAKNLSDLEIQNAAKTLQIFSQNLFTYFVERDPFLPDIMQRTGLPLEILEIFLEGIHQLNLPQMMMQGAFGQMAWADSLVRKGLEYCLTRGWFLQLFGDQFDIERMFLAISQWRAGSSIANIEKTWASNRSEKQIRLDVGRFLNHRLSLYAQFWGALVVCYEYVFGVEQNDFSNLLKSLPAFTREGVSTTLQLHWLYALGKLDRVLAHEMARVWEAMERPQESIGYLKGQLRRWRLEREPWPKQLSEKHKIALKAVIVELDY